MEDGPTVDTRQCTSCGAALPAGARFCPACAEPVPGAVGHEARKTVTLLFTDVEGSTTMGEQLDPEAYRGIMTRYFVLAREAVERHGGTVEKFVGDAVLAVFGVPEVREDDAMRAVRAARELVDGVTALSDELIASVGVRLVIRTGLNTGSVVTGDARAGGSFATGDAVNTAARLEQAAAGGEILLGEQTWTLVRDAVEVDAIEPVVVRGKTEPVPAFRLLGIRDAALRGRTSRLDAPLVGRDRETRALEDALERTLESGHSHLVTVVGAAGLGKTRLVTDFLGRVGNRADVVSGRCVSYGQGITYWPVVQLIRQALGLSGGESDEVTRHALTLALDSDPHEEQVVGLLLPLLGKSGDPASSDDTGWAIGRLLERLATRRPLVVNVDDLHWAETTLLDLLQRLRDDVADLPLLLVCQARPELLEEYPQWGTGSVNAFVFGLEPLSLEQTRSSLGSLLGPGVPDEVVASVASWSSGNPLFVEEIAAHLVEVGLLARVGERWTVRGDLASARIPPTVAALLSARLDRLPADERLVLEHASILGLEFTLEELRRLIGGGQDTLAVTAALASLNRRDLLQRTRDRRESWAFHHILVREAAYESMPKALRATLHERCAGLLEVAGDEAGPERTAFVAHHLAQAATFRAALAPQDASLPALSRRAAEALSKAADEARDRDDLAACHALASRAVALMPASGPLRRDLLAQLEQVLFDLGRLDALPDVHAMYAAALDDSATGLDHAYLESARLHHALSVSEDVDPADLEAAGRRTSALAREAGDRRRLAQGLGSMATAQMMRARWQASMDVVSELVVAGRPFEAREADTFRVSIVLYGAAPLELVLDYCDEEEARASSDLRRLRVAGFRAIAMAGLDAPGAAAQLQHAIELANEAPGGTAILGTCHWLFSDAAYVLGDLDLAVEHAESMIEQLRRDGDLAHASTLLGSVAAYLYELDRPLDQVRSTLAEARACTSRFDVISVAINAAVGAMLAARAGDPTFAAELGDEAVRVVDEGDQVWQQADVRRWVAEAARFAGDHDLERRLLAEALERYRGKHMVRLERLCADRLAQLGA